MPKILVTERELKRVIESALMQEVDTEAGTGVPTGELSTGAVDIKSLLRGPKLDLIGKLSGINANNWASRVSSRVSIRDMSSFSNSTKNGDAEIVNDFLDACLVRLFNGIPVIPLASGQPYTGLKLDAKNTIYLVATKSAIYYNASVDGSSAQAVGFGKKLNKSSNDIATTDGFKILAADPDFPEVVSGLRWKGDPTAPANQLSYFDPDVETQIVGILASDAEDAIKKAKEIKEKWSTPAYRNFLYGPLLSPRLWLADINQMSPLYTPWKMTWAACNLFLDAIGTDGEAGGLAAVMGMYANLKEYYDAGFRGDQNDLAGAREALNEANYKLILSQDELTRVIRASLALHLNEAGPTPIATSAIEKSGLGRGLARAGRATFDASPRIAELIPVINDLVNRLRQGVGQNLIQYESLSDATKALLDGLNLRTDREILINRADGLLAQRFAENPPKLSTVRSGVDPKITECYDLILKILLDAASGRDVVKSEFDDLAKRVTGMLSSLSSQDKVTLDNLLKNDREKLSSIVDMVKNRSPIIVSVHNEFLKEIANKYRSLGITKIESTGGAVEITVRGYTPFRIDPSNPATWAAFRTSRGAGADDVLKDITNSLDLSKDLAEAYLTKINDDYLVKVKEVISTGELKSRDIAQMFDVPRKRDITLGLIKTVVKAPVSWDQATDAWMGLSSSNPDRALNILRIALSFYNPSMIPAAGAGKGLRRLAGTFASSDSIIASQKQIMFVDALIGMSAFWLGEKLLLDPASHDDNKYEKLARLFLNPVESVTKYTKGQYMPLLGLWAKVYETINDYPLPDADMFKFTAQEAIEGFIDAFQSLAAFAILGKADLFQFEFESGSLTTLDPAGLVEETFSSLKEITSGVKPAIDNEIKDLLNNPEDESSVSNLRALHQNLITSFRTATSTPGDTAAADPSGTLERLEVDRQKNVDAVIKCLKTLSGSTFRAVSSSTAALNDSKKLSTYNWTRNPIAGSGREYFSMLKDFIEDDLDQDTLLGLIYGTAWTEQSSVETTRWYIQNVAPTETANLETIIQNLANDPDGKEKANKNLSDGFDEVRKIWGLIGSKYVDSLSAAGPVGKK